MINACCNMCGVHQLDAVLKSAGGRRKVGGDAATPESQET
jgi:hypothetical protein